MSQGTRSVCDMLLDSGCVVCSSLPGPVCGRCAGRLKLSAPVTVSGVDRCRAYAELDETSRAIIVALKYRGQRRVAHWLGEQAWSLVPRAADAIAWVPASPARRRQRGFDQAEQFARALSRRTDVPCVRLLGRSGGDSQQTGQSRSDRLSGPRIEAIRSCPRFVVVVDDVVTTGSSMRVAAAALRSSGTHRVVALAAAVTPDRRDGFLARPSICV